MENTIRLATHAGTWYNASPEILKTELLNYLSKVSIKQTNKLLKGLIVPHAGFRYSGPTAAWSYAHINPKLYNRIVLIGPSHKYYLKGCGLTSLQYYDTPFGPITIDTEAIASLKSIKGFQMISKDVDENEHSLEMQLPYLKMIFGDEHPLKLVPIMAGQMTHEEEQYFGKVLSEFYKDNNTLFVISSDFCHWGSRFGYTYHDETNKYPYQSIETLDKKGMTIIESLDSGNFDKYINAYKNTICGRKPISIFLNTINATNTEGNVIEFIHYEQSEKVKDFNGSSVSYAAALNLL